MTPGMSRAVLGVMLVAMWALLWGGFTVANVFSGALVVVGLYLLFPSTRPIWPRTVLHPGAVARLVVYFVVQLVTSTVLIAREVLSRQSHLRSQILEIDMRTSSQGLLTLITSIVALTPGTMAVAVRSRPPLVTIHALVLGDPIEVAESIWELEELCVRAFGTPEAIAELDADRGRDGVVDREGDGP